MPLRFLNQIKAGPIKYACRYISGIKISGGDSSCEFSKRVGDPKEGLDKYGSQIFIKISNGKPFCSIFHARLVGAVELVKWLTLHLKFKKSNLVREHISDILKCSKIVFFLILLRQKFVYTIFFVL